MRTAILIVVFAPSLAFAEPAPEQTDSTPSPTTSYLQLGAFIGVDNTSARAAYLAATLEGGHRLGELPLWIRGQLARGSVSEIYQTAESNSYLEARIGMELRGCEPRRIVCLFAGIDAGIRRERLMSDGHQLDGTYNVIVPRVGVDLGNDHVRVRPAFEIAAGTDGVGGGVSLAAAYVW